MPSRASPVANNSFRSTYSGGTVSELRGFPCYGFKLPAYQIFPHYILQGKSCQCLSTVIIQTVFRLYGICKQNLFSCQWQGFFVLINCTNEQENGVSNPRWGLRTFLLKNTTKPENIVMINFYSCRE